MLSFLFQADDGIRDVAVTGVQTCALPISGRRQRISPPDPGHDCRGRSRRSDWLDRRSAIEWRWQYVADDRRARPDSRRGAAWILHWPDRHETRWEYHGGVSSAGGIPISTVSPAYTLRRSAPRVAVLSDNGIASSGEATLIAFRLRPNTRSFGQATCGLSTSNA